MRRSLDTIIIEIERFPLCFAGISIETYYPSNSYISPPASLYSPYPPFSSSTFRHQITSYEIFLSANELQQLKLLRTSSFINGGRKRRIRPKLRKPAINTVELYYDYHVSCCLFVSFDIFFYIFIYLYLYLYLYIYLYISFNSISNALSSPA